MLDQVRSGLFPLHMNDLPAMLTVPYKYRLVQIPKLGIMGKIWQKSLLGFSKSGISISSPQFLYRHTDIYRINVNMVSS